MDWLTELFGSKNAISTAQGCARAVVVLVYGLALVRLTGRRVIGQWSALDVVIAMIIGSNLSRVVTAAAPMVGTLASTTLLIGLHWALARGSARWPALASIVEGRPIDLARDGRLDERTRLQQGVTSADIDEALRQEGLETVEQTRQVTLEPSGEISVLKRA